MNELLKCVLLLSLSGTALILLLFLCKPLLRNMPNKRWQYYLWLIVIARLLVPFAPKLNFVPISAPEAGLTVVQVTDGIGENMPFVVPAKESGGGSGDFQPTAAPVEDNGHPLWVYKAGDIFAVMLWGVWLTGAAVLFSKKVIDYHRYIKGVKKDAVQVSDLRLLDLLSECGELVGIMRPVELAVNRAVSSPMLIGFFHPCIVLPTADLTESDIRYTFLHELTHEKRHDILYKWLVQFTLCVHWFNPLVWLMSREIDRACELACDEAVISKLESRERIEYGDMLVNAVRIVGTGRSLSGFMALYESKEMIRERLGAIMDSRKKTKWITISSLLLTLCLLAASVIAGAYLMPAFTGSAEAAGVSNDVRPSGYNEEDVLFNEQFKVIEREGVYYILCDGMDELRDDFTAGVTDGCIMFAFLRIDGSYTSIGPFEVTEMLAEEVAAQCGYMLGAGPSSISQAETEFLLELAAGIQSGNVSFADADVDNRVEAVDSWNVESSIAEALKRITIYNECSMLGVVDVSHISNTVVRNVLESHAGVYSFDDVEVWLMRDQLDVDGNIVVDVEMGAIRTLIRNPEESPIVLGMRAAMEEFEDPEEKEAARQVLEAYLENVNQYYNVPNAYATGYMYRVFISRPDGSDSTAAEYEFYHVSGPDFVDGTLWMMAEHETFTETFTEEDGREHMKAEVQRIMTERAYK